MNNKLQFLKTNIPSIIKLALQLAFRFVLVMALAVLALELLV